VPRSLSALVLDAITGDYAACQAHLGPRHYQPVDWMNQSSLLVQILGPLFREVERRASFWQRVRGSEFVPVMGEPTTPNGAPEPPDVHRMIESFQLASRNLQEIWSAVLPPGVLLELTKLARAPEAQFHLPDSLWARIVYDFTLGHRLRVMNQDHLLRAMTPLYLAWVASYVLEPGDGAARLEQLASAFESAKPYAVSRWRWPDRFQP
jgi:glucosylglycerate synthase